MRILPAGVDARDVLLCQWLQVAHRGWARNARRNTIPAPAISPRALSRFPVSDAVVAGLTDSDRTPWARMLPSVSGAGSFVPTDHGRAALEALLSRPLAVSVAGKSGREGGHGNIDASDPERKSSGQNCCDAQHSLTPP